MSTGYAAHIAAQLGAHIIKVKLPSEHVEQIAAQKVYEQAEIPITTLGDRVSHIVQCCFNGRRVVIFSGGATQSDDILLDEIRAIQMGGGFGSIIGRNSFQRPKAEALTLLNQIIEIYQAEVPMRSPIMV
jgi:fructose-bisphosphate aldolase, class I